MGSGEAAAGGHGVGGSRWRIEGGTASTMDGQGAFRMQRILCRLIIQAILKVFTFIYSY